MEDNLNMPLSSVLQVIQNRVLNKTTYFGIQTLQSPNDFWVYQEILFKTKPDVLVELGNFCGGSALSFAHMMDSLGHGRIIGVDINQSRIPDIVRNHPRITLIQGDACESFNKVKSLISAGEKSLVIEDSSHTYSNTLNVLRLYSDLVQPDDYLIVEDSICHHGLETGPKPGPYEAIETFIKENNRFLIDREQESFLITWNPKGYLKCVL